MVEGAHEGASVKEQKNDRQEQEKQRRVGKSESLTRPRVPAADAKISQDAMDETFFLTNIAPQVGEGFNRHCECALCESVKLSSPIR